MYFRLEGLKRRMLGITDTTNFLILSYTVLSSKYETEWKDVDWRGQFDKVFFSSLVQFLSWLEQGLSSLNM